MTTRSPGLRALLLATGVFVLVSCGGGGGDGDPATTGLPAPVPTGWTIPVTDVYDGGPGKDGIPALNSPSFQRTADNTEIRDTTLVAGVFHEGEYRAFPHDIMNWHEVVNDTLNFNPYVLSYCPLTGSALAWDVDDASANAEFGVSGLLYNSNLILYDRLSDSHWSQMLEESVQGDRSGEMPERIQVIETSWATWRAMYPDSWVLSRNTGHVRDYDQYPYGNYRSDDQLLFPVANEDNRLHRKARVIGIRSATSSKVYQISGFGPTTQTINDQFDSESIVVVGNSEQKFAAIYNRRLSDGTILTFSPVVGQLPLVMQDNEGSAYDIFGKAVSGPRTGTQLEMTHSFTAMWFAWVAFFNNAEIHF